MYCFTVINCYLGILEYLYRPFRLMKTITKLIHSVKRMKDLNKSNFIYKSLFFILGILSLVWFLIRVIPKPQRAYYPCMRATLPLASSFVIYLISLAGVVLFFRKALNSFRENRFRLGFLILIISTTITVLTLVQNSEQASATTVKSKWFSDPLGSNSPIGTAKGIFPGRVVWVYDADATNINCTNANKANAYFQNTNTNQTIVDDMFSKGILSITGQSTHAAAWDTIFKFFNVNHGKGSVGYTNGETIFIKINAVSAWSGAGSSGEMSSNSSIEFDSSPQALLALLRSLINEGKVPQANIYLGDPMADVWNHVRNPIVAEFPNVKIVSQGSVTSGRYTLTESTNVGITYSDKKSVLSIASHSFYEEMMEADYLINVPTMKGHEWAGVTMFAKNFFGVNTTDHSWELHYGLINNDNKGMREDYKMYRVLVDLMACKYLGGNTLLYFMDGLWSSSWEHQEPQKYLTWPFNNDWSSSLFFSLDPVAIESVGIDIMQKEFTVEVLNSNPPKRTFANYGACDDYLHQAASSDWWPTGIIYDPDSTGSAIGSLGVHEHWDNDADMRYSGDLGTGQGIELIKIFKEISGIDNIGSPLIMNIYPNPCKDNATLQLNLTNKSLIVIEVFSSKGDKVFTQYSDNMVTGEQKISLNMSGLSAGVYFCRINATNGQTQQYFTQRIIVE